MQYERTVPYRKSPGMAWVVPILVGLALMTRVTPGALSTTSAPTVSESDMVVDSFVVTLPQGEVQVRLGPHALEKHEAGTMPASVIRAEIERGNYTTWYSRQRQQYLILVRLGSECGGMIVRYNQFGDGQYSAPTVYGGSEACAKALCSCEYWLGVIAADEYVPIAVI